MRSSKLSARELLKAYLRRGVIGKYQTAVK
jgi:hypothetical protein